jgi:probable rRNA maturation factor
MIIFDNTQDKIEFNDEMKLLIERTIKGALEHEKFEKPYEISFLITDNSGIREINREHRKIDRETDVLSFPMLEFKTGYYKGQIELNVDDLNPDTGEVVLGDIVISIEKATAQAEEYGHSLEREMAFLTVHSILHLLGHDHEVEDDRVIMRKKEVEILNELGLYR